ncbi:MAG: hypothetical protein ACK5Y2_09600 [Bdellovibrionales bacterium]
MYHSETPFSRAWIAGFLAVLSLLLPVPGAFAHTQTHCRQVLAHSELRPGSGGASLSVQKNPWREALKTLRANLENPYTLAADLKDVAKTLRTTPDELLKRLEQALLPSEKSSVPMAEALHRWIRTDEQALIVYDLLVQSGLEQNREVVDYLKMRSPFFREARQIQSSFEKASPAFLTYSFEKETLSSNIGFLFRTREYSEEQWFQLTDLQRLQKLESLEDTTKVFQPASRVPPTSLRPSFVSGFSSESKKKPTDPFISEVSHKAYEFNLSRTFSQIKELSQLFREDHSIHLHIVFEIKREGPLAFRQALELWYKKLNDYLYFCGLEEGLHASKFVSFFNLTADSYREPTPEWKPRITFDDSWDQSLKYPTAGLRRGEMYGPASDPSFLKLGIELRDASRSLEKLKMHANLISDSLSEQRWQNAISQDPLRLLQSTRLIREPKNTRRELKKHLDDTFATLFSELEPMAVIPLTEFEKGEFFNFRTGRFSRPSPEQIARIQEARQIFVTDLGLIQAELKRMDEKNESYEHQDVTGALRMILSEWAKKAQLSELFSGL